MPEHSIPSPATPPPPTTTLPPLLTALQGLLRVHRPAFRQGRTFLRAQALLLGHLFAFARRNSPFCQKTLISCSARHRSNITSELVPTSVAD